jgi:hypothetical protein
MKMNLICQICMRGMTIQGFQIERSQIYLFKMYQYDYSFSSFWVQISMTILFFFLEKKNHYDYSMSILLWSKRDIKAYHQNLIAILIIKRIQFRSQAYASCGPQLSIFWTELENKRLYTILHNFVSILDNLLSQDVDNSILIQ